ncbi:myeloid cell nuclear differentiation antigen-like protein [Acomys russatus]|uniref:myeloid cell nuclear differentiation antigen-like protein n=1 Tax=Acomys russatus TaxID=60746 RepID=UPI0021E2BCFB|nr:myeloid cell nuclear differentiation antigen-like protein [Acomys russatus]
MASEYKKIVLLQGLESIEDYQFRTIKSLLRKELKLTKKMQDEYDRIQMADLMEDKFPKDAGLDKLIDVCKDIEGLEDLAENLKTEKAKVKKRKKGEGKTTVKKRKQREPSSSQSLSTNNESSESKPSSTKKRKQPTKAEGGKKRMLTQEQTGLPEPSGTNIQNDESCLQTPHKPPPTPSSSSSKKVPLFYSQCLPFSKHTTGLTTTLEKLLTNPLKQKNTVTKKHSITKTEVCQEKHQFLEFSATSHTSAVSQHQTLQGCSAIGSSSHQMPQTPLKAHLSLKMPQGSPAPPCQKFSVSPTSNSNVHMNSLAPPAPFSVVLDPHLLSATASNNVWVPLVPSETVSSSLSPRLMSPGTEPSSVQDVHLPTAAAFGSTEDLHSLLTMSRSVQTTSVPTATPTSKARLVKPPPATASSYAQVPHALPATVSRSISATQVPQRAASSIVPSLKSATVKASGNSQTPQVSSPAVAISFQASPASPPSTCSSLSGLRVPMPIATSRIQTTQMHLGTAPSCLQALHATPPTVSRSVCNTQVPQGAASSTGQALPCPRRKASRSAQAPRVPSATTSSRLLAPCAFPPTSSGNLLAPQLSPATAFSALQASTVPPATARSSPSRMPRKGIIPKEPSREEGHQKGPKQVMVLKVTEPFIYDMREDKRMFHATVATETEFFRVKVFETALKTKFIPRKIIAISDCFGCNGFLEIYRESCVSDVNVSHVMVISNTLRQRANATPKISHLFTQEKGTFVNGEFAVTKKYERDQFIFYGIEDDSGKMEVVVYGRLTSIKCEPGNKLRLACFELTPSEGDVWQLRSARYSYMKVYMLRNAILPINHVF